MKDFSSMNLYGLVYEIDVSNPELCAMLDPYIESKVERHRSNTGFDINKYPST